MRGATSGEPLSVTADGEPIGLIVYTPTTHTAFSDDMESGPGGWTADGFSLVVSGTGYYSSPEHAWWADDVTHASTATLTSAPITIPFSTARYGTPVLDAHGLRSLNGTVAGLECRIRDEDGDWPPWSEVAPTDIVRGG